MQPKDNKVTYLLVSVDLDGWDSTEVAVHRENGSVQLYYPGREALRGVSRTLSKYAKYLKINVKTNRISLALSFTRIRHDLKAAAIEAEFAHADKVRTQT